MCINTNIINKIKFYYLIIDEAHRIKNENSKLSLVVRQYNVERRMLITGTPLQNNIKELWALLNFLVPEIFQDSEAFEALVQSKEADNNNEETDDDVKDEGTNNEKDEVKGDENDDVKGEEINEETSEEIVVKKYKRTRKISDDESVNDDNKQSNVNDSNKGEGNNEDTEDAKTAADSLYSSDLMYLRKMITPFFLRREKSEVEQTLLPKKIVNLYPCLSEMQRIWYRTILKKDLKTELNIYDNSSLMNVVCQLRKVCNHPYLFDGAEPEPFTTDEHIVNNSCKMIILDKLLLKCYNEKSRVLIFSQMSRMLDIIEDYCQMRDYTYRRLDGSTTTEDRTKGIDEFNSDNSIFLYLLTTRAGGLGINLTSADTVIIYDSDWNPQMDLQAMDRAHRIGQKKEVKVYRFIVSNTIEEKILERCMHKLKLDECLMKKRNEKLHKNELLNIISTGIENLQEKGASDNLDIEAVLRDGETKTMHLNEKINGINFGEQKGLDLYKWEGEDYKKRVKKLEEIIEVENKSVKERKRIALSDYQFYSREYEELLNKEILNEEEEKRKEELRKEGFDITRKEFVSYLRSVEAVGKDVEMVIKHMRNKERHGNDKGSNDNSDRKGNIDFDKESEYNNEEVCDINRNENVDNTSRNDCNDNKSRNECNDSNNNDYTHSNNEIINGLPVSEWRRFHNIFWQRKDEIEDFDKILAQIERNETRKCRNENIKKILKSTFGETHSKSKVKEILKENGFLFFDDFKLVYSQNVKSKFYTEIVDKTLLFLYYNFVNYEERMKMVKETLSSLEWVKHDYYVLTRDENELGKRISALAGMLLKRL